MAEQLRFEFVDGTVELVRHGSPRYRELIEDGHAPAGTVPGSAGISATLDAYLTARFGAAVPGGGGSIPTDADGVPYVTNGA